MPLLLNAASISSLPGDVATPRYDFARLPAGIVHLGIGAFHRAHQAVYTDDAIAASGGDWGICGVSLRSPDVRDQLIPQDGLYTVVDKAGSGNRYRVVGSVRDVLFLGDEGDAIVERIAAPATRIVSMTVTEKGYCHDPATGKLNLGHPQIAHDLRHPHDPQSTVGVVVRGLERRQANGGGPLTILCCDNLPHNGRTVEGLIDTFARERDGALANWIAANTTFPSSMVDRIVPASTGDDIADVRRALGVLDRAPVVAEPFSQWVVEDRFAAGRPAWDLVGAEFVTDVEPFEVMKFRLLNGSHSALAYLGFLAGYETIWQVAASPDFIGLMRALMEEATPTLALPSGVDLAAYRTALIERFANPALPHRTQQIAMDGSQKLPQRMLGTVRDNLAASRSIDFYALAVAAWMRYVMGIDEAGKPIKVSDPMADEFARIAGACGNDPGKLVSGFLSLRPIFGDDLPANPQFVARVTAWLSALLAEGSSCTVARAVSRDSNSVAISRK